MLIRDFITQEIKELHDLTNTILKDESLLQSIEKIALLSINAIKNNHKILFAGNGGSAADSQHLAAELVCRLQFNRPGIAGIALTTDSSALTAIGNDFGYEAIFSRQIEAIGQAGDVFYAFSTSGNSPNIRQALMMARSKAIVTVGFSGIDGGKMQEYCDEIILIPTHKTPKIQECHIMVGHIICAWIESSLYGNAFENKK